MIQTKFNMNSQRRLSLGPSSASATAESLCIVSSHADKSGSTRTYLDFSNVYMLSNISDFKFSVV